MVRIAYIGMGYGMMARGAKSILNISGDVDLGRMRFDQRWNRMKDADRLSASTCNVTGKKRLTISEVNSV
jgi:hypothetical protein